MTTYAEWRAARGCQTKRGYARWEDALKALYQSAERYGDDPFAWNVYRCDCGRLHVGHGAGWTL